MILSELVKLYDRLAEDPEFSERIPRMGTSVQNITFSLVLTPEGKLFDVRDERCKETVSPKKKGGEPTVRFVPRKVIVPGSAHPSSINPTPRFLWDQPAYLLGYSDKGAQDDAKAREKLFPAYRAYHRSLLEKYDIQDRGFRAVVAFLDAWNPSAVPEETKGKIASFGPGFGLFRLQGEFGYVYESPELRKVWGRESGTKDLPLGNCLVTGRIQAPIVSVVETKVKLAGTSVGGGALTSFNASSSESYGKSQTLNAPISEEAGFKFSNALNLLLADGRFHCKVASTTVVFWTAVKTQTESVLGLLFGASAVEPSSAVDKALVDRLKIFWRIVAQAGNPDLSDLGDDARTPFFALGIEPNAARIVVRFWHESTLGDLILRLRRHQSDMAIRRTFENEDERLSLRQILLQTAREADGVPPPLAGSLLRSVLEGLPYPASLYQLVLGRIQVSHGDARGRYRVGGKVTYGQASVVKGYLVRNKQRGDIGMSLNESNTAPAYLLGRLFALLEKTQGEALGDLNAGIGDKYYSAASATPRIAFPTLLNYFRKWLKKLAGERKGLAVVRSRQAGDLMDGLDASEGFPANLSLEDRGLFALGYYQQMRAFFTRREPEGPAESNDVQ